MKKLLVLLLSLSLVFCCACESDTNTSTKETSVTVYVTKSGSKYHSYGCTYLKKSCIEKDLSVAEMQGYTPCSKCR